MAGIIVCKSENGFNELTFEKIQEIFDKEYSIEEDKVLEIIEKAKKDL